MITLLLGIGAIASIVFGISADNIYHMTGKYPYKIDLYGVANLLCLLFLLSLAYYIAKL